MADQPVNQQDIIIVYDELRRAQDRYQVDATEAIEARQDFERKFSHALVTGEIEGKNDTSRRGKFDEAYPEIIERILDTEAQRDNSRHQLKLAEIEVERIRALLRLAEVMAQIDRSKS